MKYREPKAKVISFSREENIGRVVLHFDTLPREPIAPASLFPSAESSVREIDLHRVLKIDGKEVTFEACEVGDTVLESGTVYVLRSWWTYYELELITDKTISWRRERFETRDALEYKDPDGCVALRKLKADEKPDGGNIVPGGWEHEHCGLCSKTISSLQGEENFGYTDGEDWVCDACYKKYIASDFRDKLG